MMQQYSRRAMPLLSMTKPQPQLYCSMQALLLGTSATPMCFRFSTSATTPQNETGSKSSNNIFEKKPKGIGVKRWK